MSARGAHTEARIGSGRVGSERAPRDLGRKVRTPPLWARAPAVSPVCAAEIPP